MSKQWGEIIPVEFTQYCMTYMCKRWIFFSFVCNCESDIDSIQTPLTLSFIAQNEDVLLNAK